MSQPKRVLVIDDEPDIRELLEITLMRMGIHSETAFDVNSAISQIKTNEFDLILSDMKLPDGTGLDIVHYLSAQNVKTPIAIITAHASMDLAVESLKAGAFDFISKPIDIKKLRSLITQALKVDNSPKTQIDPVHAPNPSIGQSQAMAQLEKRVCKLAVSQAPVFIQGESGTGKEMAAKRIHNLGPRSDKPFIPVNCGAIPAELMESEFFGHLKGAFTGAMNDKDGFFAAANGGTLFLDEVADLPLAMQVKLLRAIQEKKIRPVGSQTEVDVDVRILSATHKDVQAMVDQDLFRQDLFYRINVINLEIPPLRERHEDIPALCEHLLKRLSGNYGHASPILEKDALKALSTYSFPGNVRELENILERAFALCDEDIIHKDDLDLNDDTTNVFKNIDATTLANKPPEVSLETYLMDIERTLVEQALEDTRWNKTAAAKKLGITFRALRYRLKKLGID